MNSCFFNNKKKYINFTKFIIFNLQNSIFSCYRWRKIELMYIKVGIYVLKSYPLKFNRHKDLNM